MVQTCRRRDGDVARRVGVRFSRQMSPTVRVRHSANKLYSDPGFACTLRGTEVRASYTACMQCFEAERCSLIRVSLPKAKDG